MLPIAGICRNLPESAGIGIGGVPSAAARRNPPEYSACLASRGTAFHAILAARMVPFSDTTAGVLNNLDPHDL